MNRLPPFQVSNGTEKQPLLQPKVLIHLSMTLLDLLKPVHHVLLLSYTNYKNEGIVFQRDAMTARQ